MTPVRAQGLYFLRKHNPAQASRAADGVFVLRLLVHAERPAPSASPVTQLREPWTIHFSGPSAEAWHSQHAAQLLPGVGLHAQLKHPRVHTSGASSRPEIHADAITLDIAPPRWPVKAEGSPADHPTETTA